MMTTSQWEEVKPAGQGRIGLDRERRPESIHSRVEVESVTYRKSWQFYDIVQGDTNK